MGKLRKQNALDAKNAEANAAEETAGPEVPQNLVQDALSLQTTVVMQIEKKHTSEQDALLQLFDELSTAENALVSAAREMSVEDRKEKLNVLSLKEKKWKDSELKKIRDGSGSVNSENNKEHMDLLKEGLAIAMAIIQEADPSKSPEDLPVQLMADLQEKQTSESNGIITALADMDESSATKILDYQIKSQSSSLLENLSSAIFSVKPTDKQEESGDEEKKEIENEIEKQKQQMEEELEKEKEKLEGLSEQELGAEMDKIKAQQAARLRAMQENADRQKAAVRARLEAKR